MTDPFATYSNELRDGACENPFAALDQLCQDVIGHRLFSCSHFFLKSDGKSTAARVYTSDERNYPRSGLKDIVPNRWTGIVIDRRKTFVANSVDGFADVFPDHAFIASLGLGSVINLPVILKGEFLGTINLLHNADHYQPERLKSIGSIETAAQLAFALSSKPASPAAG